MASKTPEFSNEVIVTSIGVTVVQAEAVIRTVTIPISRGLFIPSS